MDLTQTKVSDSVFVIDGNYPGGGNVTSTIVHSKGEAFVFDSLLYPEDTRKLLSLLKDLNLDIKGLVNTHWHVDHTAGNQYFLDAKRIISHSLCPDLMHADNLDWLNDELKGRDKVEQRYPNEAIAEGSVLRVGEVEVEVFHTPGHTPDSIIGRLKDKKVLIAGDTVMEIPFVGYGDSQALDESLNRVKSISRGAKIVQGHGGVCESEKLDGDMRYIHEVRRRTTEYLSSGKTMEQAAADIKLEDCVTKERFQYLTRDFGPILGVHPENVKRIYLELETKTR